MIKLRTCITLLSLTLMQSPVGTASSWAASTVDVLNKEFSDLNSLPASATRYLRGSFSDQELRAEEESCSARLCAWKVEQPITKEVISFVKISFLSGWFIYSWSELKGLMPGGLPGLTGGFCTNIVLPICLAEAITSSQSDLVYYSSLVITKTVISFARSHHWNLLVQKAHQG